MRDISLPGSGLGVSGSKKRLEKERGVTKGQERYVGSTGDSGGAFDVGQYEMLGRESRLLSKMYTGQREAHRKIPHEGSIVVTAIQTNGTSPARSEEEPRHGP